MTNSVPHKPLSEDTLVQTKAPDVVREMFHSISPTYDMLNHLLSLNIDKRWRRFVARQTINSTVADILDVCGGTGDMALSLAERINKLNQPARIVSSDFTAAMMQIGNRKFQKAAYGAANPVALVADTMGLPFRDHSFDLVTVAFGIRNVSDPLAGLKEMARVCRPGGTVAVLEFSKTRHALINGGFSLYFTRLLPLIGHAVTGTRAYSYLSKSVEKFPEGEEFGRLLSSATGGKVTMHRLSLGIATLYMSRKPASGK